MGLFRRKPAPGTRWDGPAAWCDDASVDHRRGFYALTDDGKALRRPLVRLVGVDDAPGDPTDGAWHLEVAGPDDPPQKEGRIVSFEFEGQGRAGVAS